MLFIRFGKNNYKYLSEAFMKYHYFFIFVCALQMNVNQLHCKKKSSPVEEISLQNWKNNSILQQTSFKPAHTAILIIAPRNFGNSFIENRWKLGEKLWEQYMNNNPNVDCYFIVPACFKKDSIDQVWIEGNTIYVADVWYENARNDRLLYKTIRSLEFLLPNYTHFIRANINTFFNLRNVNSYMENHHQSFFTIPTWQSAWYAIGYGIVFTADVAAHMINEYYRLESLGEELISHHHADDGAITALATGVWPYDNRNPFKKCEGLPFGTRQLMCSESLNTLRFCKYGMLLTPLNSANEGIALCENAGSEVMLYRTREGLSLNELALLYEYFLDKTYPELEHINFVDYANYLINAP